MTAWSIERLTGSARALHERDALADSVRRVSVLEVDSSALVLGSTQRNDIVDAEAATRMGLDVVRRRTGGGAVVLSPGAQLWIDMTLPPSDPLWQDDVVAKAFEWVGRVWADALHDVGVDGVVANEAAVCHSVLGRLICFAGLGFGEVSGPDGKIVGVSQRRTRRGAWFQCAVMRQWDVDSYRALLAPGLGGLTDEATRELADIRVQSVVSDRDDVVEAFVSHLPA